MTEQPHQPGDIVDGQILGADNRWHPLAGQTQAAALDDATAGTEAPGDWKQVSSGSAVPGVGANASPRAGASRGVKVGLGIASGAVLLIGGLALIGAVGAETPATTSGPSASPSTTASRSTTPSEPVPSVAAKPDIDTLWASLPAAKQLSLCADFQDPTRAPSAAGFLVTQVEGGEVNIKALAAEKCPAPAPKEYALLDERTWQLIAKNPDQYLGQTFLVFGQVTQFDSATGPTTFRADVAHANVCSYGFFNGDNTLLDGGVGVDLSNLVNDDVFAAQVTVLGSQSYSTTLGGSTTVPWLQVDSIELQQPCQ